MPTFWRNILSPSSGLKWRCWEVEGFEKGQREGRLREWATPQKKTSSGYVVALTLILIESSFLNKWWL
jgi:hypothetical protein